MSLVEIWYDKLEEIDIESWSSERVERMLRGTKLTLVDFNDPPRYKGMAKICIAGQVAYYIAIVTTYLFCDDLDPEKIPTTQILGRSSRPTKSSFRLERDCDLDEPN